MNMIIHFFFGQNYFMQEQVKKYFIYLFIYYMYTILKYIYAYIRYMYKYEMIEMYTPSEKIDHTL